MDVNKAMRILPLMGRMTKMVNTMRDSCLVVLHRQRTIQLVMHTLIKSNLVVDHAHISIDLEEIYIRNIDLKDFSQIFLKSLKDLSLASLDPRLYVCFHANLTVYRDVGFVEFSKSWRSDLFSLVEMDVDRATRTSWVSKP